MKKPTPWIPSGSNLNRRRFLAVSAAPAAAFMVLPRYVLGGQGRVPPSEKLNLAVIGAGGRGRDDLEEGLKSQNIVALCDVDARRATDTFKEYPKATRYQDFRVLFDREKNIDAVLVATPDHTHAVASMAAIRHGKNVYCEKPLTRTVYEARALAKAAAKSGVATQMGNQGMAFEGNRLIKEWIWAGVIGPVREVHVWSDRPTHRGRMPLWWAQGIERPADTPPVPAGLNWDLWLGPAPQRPYHPAYVPFQWRGWWDFGSGGLGDMGIHNLAPVFTALKLGAPSSVHATSTPVFKETIPLAATVHFEFAARGDMPAVALHWYDGGLLPQRPEELDDDEVLDPEDGIIFVGDKGKMLVRGWGGESPRLIPSTRHRAFEPPPQTLPRSLGHHQEWIKACKEGTPTESDFSFAGPLTEAVLLGSIAIRMKGEILRWDSANLKIVNLPEAESYLHYPYRQGWSL